MRKHAISIALWAAYLLLFVVGWWVVRQLQDALNEVKTDLHNVSQQLEKTDLALQKYEKSHGSAEEEISALREEIAILSKLASEHDSLINSLGIQLSQ